MLSPADDVTRGGHRVAVIFYKSWQTRFGGAVDVVGSTIKLNAMLYTVVGISSPGFHGTERFYAPEAFVPTSMVSQIEAGANYLDNRNVENTFILARLKPGFSVTRPRRTLMR